MQITYRESALLADVNIEGVEFHRGQTIDVHDLDLAKLILRNPHFEDEHGRNAFSCGNCDAHVAEVGAPRGEDDQPRCATCAVAGDPEPDAAPVTALVVARPFGPPAPSAPPPELP